MHFPLFVLALASVAFGLSQLLTGDNPGAAAGGTCNGKPVTGAVATAGSDVLLGTSGADDIDGLGGNDIICGGGGGDTLSGGPGKDKLLGQAGDDHLFGDDGADDSLNGGTGKDHCDGGKGVESSISCDILVNFTVVAQSTRFNIGTITVEAGEDLTVALKNKDGLSHNLAFFDGATLIARTSAPALGPNVKEKNFVAPGPGAYSFRCQIHATMSGSFIVE